MTLTNSKLVAYGIQTENSDIRIHVSVVTKALIIYKTKEVLAFITRRNYQKREVYSTIRGERVLTAEGYLLPVDDIPNVAIVPIPDGIYSQYPVGEFDTTTQKGDKCANIVRLMLVGGLIPLPMTPEMVTDLQVQIQGNDIIAHMDWRIQVKCDFKAGRKAQGGTGNVFIQIAESNPLKNH